MLKLIFSIIQLKNIVENDCVLNRQRHLSHFAQTKDTREFLVYLGMGKRVFSRFILRLFTQVIRSLL